MRWLVLLAGLALATSAGAINCTVHDCQQGKFPCCTLNHIVVQEESGVPPLTVTPTYTITGTPVATNTPTVTPTPTSVDFGQLFLANISQAGTSAVYDASMYNANTNASITPGAGVPLKLPVAIRARSLYVYCVTAPGSGKTLTAQLRKNASDISGASCSMANTTSCNVDLTNDSTADYAAGDYLDWSLTQTTGSATSSKCYGTLYYRNSGDTAEQDAIIVAAGGAGLAHPVSNQTTYCGPWIGPDINASNAARGCLSTSSNLGRLLNEAGTLSGLAMFTAGFFTVNGAPRIDFTLITGNGANTSDLTGAFIPTGLDTGTLNFLDTTCTTNCALADGELVQLKGVANANWGGSISNAFYLSGSYSIADSPAQFTVGLSDTAINVRYENPIWTAGDTTTGPLRSAKAVQVQRLFAFSETGGHTQTVTVYTGSGPGGSLSASSLTCDIGAGTNQTCSDTTHSVQMSAGDYIAIGISEATVGTTGANVKAVVELAGIPVATSTSTTTPTATATATASVTNTPVSTNTVTATATSTKTPVPGSTSTATATATPTVTLTPTPTATPAAGSTATATNTAQTRTFTPAAPDVGELINEQAGTLTCGEPTFFSAGTFQPQRSKAPRTGILGCVTANLGVVKWNTSALGGTASISACALVLTRTGASIQSADSWGFTAAWYAAPASWSSSDYTDAYQTSAFETATDIASYFSSGTTTVPLSNCAANINQTGVTALRTWIRNLGTPTGLNWVTFDPATVTLSVTYS